MTENVALAAVAIGMTSPLIALLVFVRRKRHKVIALLGSRVPLDAKTFGSQFFGDVPIRAELAAEIRTLLSEHVPFAIDGLRPDDRLLGDLWMHQWSHLAVGEFMADLSDAYSINLSDCRMTKQTTFRDLLEQVEQRARKA